MATKGSAGGNHDLPFAKELFEAADRMRGSVESAEYKHLVLAEIAQALVRAVREDLSVDWTSHESTEAAIRLKIKHLLRRYTFETPVGGGRSPARKLDQVADLILEQARAIYRYWPEALVSELPY